VVVVVVVTSVGTEGNLSVLRGLLRRGWLLLSVSRGVILLEEGFFSALRSFCGEEDILSVRRIHCFIRTGGEDGICSLGYTFFQDILER